MFLFSRLSSRLEDGLLRGAAGVMLAAAFFALLIPAQALAFEQYHHSLGAALAIAASIALGAFALHTIHKRAPHEHFTQGLEGPASDLRRMWLFVIAITLHNFPEGLAVGVGFSDGELASGLPLTAGIAIQNVPEGLAVAIALLSVGHTRTHAGLVEPIGGLVGAIAISFAEAIVPWAMGFAAGAMLFVISNEIIPETHQRGHADLATASLLCGFILMIIIDAGLGG